MFVLEIAWMWFMSGVNQGEGCFACLFQYWICLFGKYHAWILFIGGVNQGRVALLVYCYAEDRGRSAREIDPIKCRMPRDMKRLIIFISFTLKSFGKFQTFFRTGSNNQYYVYSSQFFGCWYICSLAAATLWWNSRADTCNFQKGIFNIQINNQSNPPPSLLHSCLYSFQNQHISMIQLSTLLEC